jgi:hypothetical protein
VLASTAVPLSLVSFLAASSFFFCAAICHAGIAARPEGSLPYEGGAFSVDGVEAAGVLLPACASVLLVPLDGSVGAGVDEGCGAGVEVPDVLLTFGVGVAL